MEVVGTIELTDEPLEFDVVRHCADGSVSSATDAVQSEALLDVYVNDIPTMQIGCSKSHLVELVVGRLFSEGLVENADEITVMSVCENSMRADVILKNRAADLTRKSKRLVPTCCTNSVTLNDYFGLDEPLSPVQPIPWTDEWVFRQAREFAQDKTAHARTRGVHSAYLSTPEATLCVREDIGRHNAFDKVIGWALMNDVDLTQCMIYTSGRVPTDMVTKAIRAGIPLLVSKAVATDKTVKLARELGLTLICSATPQSFDVMSAPDAAPDSAEAAAETPVQEAVSEFAKVPALAAR